MYILSTFAMAINLNMCSSMKNRHNTQSCKFSEFASYVLEINEPDNHKHLYYSVSFNIAVIVEKTHVYLP